MLIRITENVMKLAKIFQTNSKSNCYKEEQLAIYYFLINNNDNHPHFIKELAPIHLVS